MSRVMVPPPLDGVAGRPVAVAPPVGEERRGLLPVRTVQHPDGRVEALE